MDIFCSRSRASAGAPAKVCWRSSFAAAIMMTCAFTPCTSTTLSDLPSSTVPTVRKRTSSFSTPNKPLKSVKMGSRPGLRRTASFIVLPEYVPQGDLRRPSQPSISERSSDHLSNVPYTRTLQYYKEQRDKRKTQSYPGPRSTLDASTSSPSPPSSPSAVSSPPSTSITQHGSKRSANSALSSKPRMRTTSPLASSPVSPRAFSLSRFDHETDRLHPRGKREPDLYRAAIFTRMRCSPEGQKILSMGPHLAVSMLTATRELERMVAGRDDRDRNQGRNSSVLADNTNDQSSADCVLSNSWVVVPKDTDWEMVDCT